jgi:hypothetical protein
MDHAANPTHAAADVRRSWGRVTNLLPVPD